ncbi:hypothetical protein [Paenibacillus sp. GXUN7292]|uniref:hypothetical protein n=1 Tax=Paenibacillus sp. GXUN7292 TaxID=3422499 RepID=UPI003D7F0D7D
MEVNQLMKNQKGIIVAIIVVIALAGIPLLSTSLETYLITVAVALLAILLALFVRKRIKNKLIMGHLGAVILFLFLWYMDRFTNSNVSYFAVVLYYLFMWMFYFMGKKK